MRTMSQAARDKLTKPWEETILYVYDDKQPKRRVNGRLQYPEWDGGAVRGTLTIGVGHTDAAGPMPFPLPPKIRKGLRITPEQAEEIFAKDMEPCERQVNGWLKRPVTQHQYDALVDTDFNCPKAALEACRLINSGNARAVPSKLLQFTYSRGEFMRGLVNRRNAEIKWFNTPDNPEEAEVEEIFSPKAERNPPPKSMVASKTGAAAAAIGTGSVTVTSILSQFNDAAEPVKAVKQNLADLGVLDQMAAFAQSPAAAVAITLTVAGLAVFVWLDRRNKLVSDHV